MNVVNGMARTVSPHIFLLFSYTVWNPNVMCMSVCDSQTVGERIYWRREKCGSIQLNTQMNDEDQLYKCVV
jgi:hypothetical protein